MHYRAGSTSYVYPAGIVENVRRLALCVSDIELILFDLEDGPSNLPGADDVAELRQIAGEHDLTYTVHLPLDLRGDAPHDSRLWRVTERVVHSTVHLQPWAWVFHLDGAGIDEPGWVTRGVRAVERLAALTGDRARLALENLETYPPEALEPVYDATQIARTLDIGHLWKSERDPFDYLPRWLPHTRVVHLHGCTQVHGVLCDHLPLTALPESSLDAILTTFDGWSGVLTLEVFEDDFFSSRDALVAARSRVERAHDAKRP